MKKILSIILTLSMLASVIFCGSFLTDVNAQADDVAISVYTGEVIPAAQAVVRPIAVMMPTDKAAQPSYGISNAKVLYEVMEEGNISRQLAVIDDWAGLERIGNIRSCREYYIHLATEWDPILIHFGGVVYMKDRISMPDIDNLSGTYEYGVGGNSPGSGSFYRTSDRKVPHNAYIGASGITKAATNLGYSLTIRPQYYQPSHFTFSPVPNTLEQYPAFAVANNIDLSGIFSYTKSSLKYDATTGNYLKYIHGAAQKDGNNGQQISFANVVIQFTPWQKLDAKGYLAFATVGSGEGYFCTKGRAIHCTWTKLDDHTPTKYYDDFGNEILFNVGKTYIAVAQLGKQPSFS